MLSTWMCWLLALPSIVSQQLRAEPLNGNITVPSARAETWRLICTEMIARLTIAL